MACADPHYSKQVVVYKARQVVFDTIEALLHYDKLESSIAVGCEWLCFGLLLFECSGGVQNEILAEILLLSNSSVVPVLLFLLLLLSWSWAVPACASSKWDR